MKLTLEGLALDQGAFKVRMELALVGDSVALFGPSGSGKTTLLEVVAGLRAGAGRICLDGRVLQDTVRGIRLEPWQRRIGYVPQDLALFPHLNVEGNLRFGLRGSAGPTVAEVAGALGLGRRLGADVGVLSGGERRRVALGRALLANPTLLLLDEPTANLDPSLRRQVADLLKTVRREFGVPWLLVSHDPGEICGLCDQVALIEQGHCGAVGEPFRLLKSRRRAASSRPAATAPRTPLAWPSLTSWREALC